MSDRVNVSVSVRVLVPNSNEEEALRVGRGVTVSLCGADAEKGDRVWCVLVIDGSSEGDPADCVAVRDVENVSLLVNSSETVSVSVKYRGVNVIMGVNVWVSVRVTWFVASDAEMVSVWTQPTLTVGTRAGRQKPSGSPIPIPEHTQSHAPVIDELSGKKHAISRCKHVEQTYAV